MGTKSYKNLECFDEIFVRIFCRRIFRYGLYGGNILLDGEMFCLGMVSTNLYIMLFYAGEIQNLNCRRLEMATYFFLTSRGDLQEQTKL